MTISPRTEDLRDVGWQVGATLPEQRENGDSFVDGVDHAAVVDGDTLTGYVWFGGWQQIWQVSRATDGVLAGVAEAVAALSGTVTAVRTGTLGAVAEAVAALSGTVTTPGPSGTLAAQAEAVAAITGTVVVSGQLGATAEAVSALSGTAGGFDPLSISWHTAFWADDPNWTDPGDGNNVSQWDDASGNSRHATPIAGNPPIFRSSVTALNSQSAVEFVPNDGLGTSSFGTNVGTRTIAVVGNMTDEGFFCDGLSLTTRGIIYKRSGNWQIYAGSQLTGSTYDSAAHLFVAHFLPSGTDSLDIDGTTDVSGTAGNQNQGGIRLGRSLESVDEYMAGHIAFLGFFSGTLTAQQKSDLLAWSQSYYDTP